MDDRDPLITATPPPREEAEIRRCAHPDCGETGRYKAPLSPRATRDFVWLCLDHVRAHNAAWDYFANMNADEIEAARRADSVWERPTWRLGSLGAWSSDAEFHFDEGFGGFGKSGGDAGEALGKSASRPLSAEQRRAFAVLGLDRGASKQDVKARYKMLAKKLHPDANGSDPKAEEKLKRINQAYETLKNLA